MADIYVAVSSFATVHGGRPVMVRKGSTAREGHPLLVAYPGLFKLLVPTYEYEAPKPPSEPEPVKPPPPPKAVVPPKATATPKPATAGAKVDDKE